MRALLAVMLLCMLSACSDSPPPPAKFNAIDITGAADWGRGFKLKNSSGQVRELADFKGKAVVLFFGFTQCPDVCPSTLASAAAALKLLGPDAQKVQVVFITLDPARDTSEIIGSYAKAFDPGFIALTGSDAEIAAATKEFKIFVEKLEGSTPSTYTINHTAMSYVFDPAGRLRLGVRHGTTPEQLAADLKQLLEGR